LAQRLTCGVRRGFQHDAPRTSGAIGRTMTTALPKRPTKTRPAAKSGGATL
jgi:hypothetical protein